MSGTRIHETVSHQDDGTAWVRLRCPCATHRRDLAAWEDPEAALDDLHELHRRECPTCPHRARVRATHGKPPVRPPVVARAQGVLRARCATCGAVRALGDLVAVHMPPAHRRWHCAPCAPATRHTEGAAHG